MSRSFWWPLFSFWPNDSWASAPVCQKLTTFALPLKGEGGGASRKHELEDERHVSFFTGDPSACWLIRLWWEKHLSDFLLTWVVEHQYFCLSVIADKPPPNLVTYNSNSLFSSLLGSAELFLCCPASVTCVCGVGGGASWLRTWKAVTLTPLTPLLSLPPSLSLSLVLRPHQQGS